MLKYMVYIVTTATHLKVSYTTAHQTVSEANSGNAALREVTEESKRLYNKELYALYSSPHIIRVIKSRRLRWAGHIARIRERRRACRVLVGKPEERRGLGRSMRRQDNIKVDLREVGWGTN
jgi:hypothetical protein